jgi:hypothetical protein
LLGENFSVKEFRRNIVTELWWKLWRN